MTLTVTTKSWSMSPRHSGSLVCVWRRHWVYIRDSRQGVVLQILGEVRS